LHRNEWHVRQARLLLQERAARPGWKGAAVHAALREILASTDRETPQRLRALWALHVTGGLDAGRLLALLDDRSEHVRGWGVRLVRGGASPSREALGRFAALARRAPSPVVRLSLASALQRLPLPGRWAIAGGLVSHAGDATDANLPLMV